MQVTHKNGIEEKDGNIISELISRYLPYWPLFAILTVLSLGLAWAYLRYTSPVFEISATILVKDEKKGVDDQNLMEQLDLFGSKKLVENEIEVIKSRMLMREVVEKLDLYAPVTSVGTVRSHSGYYSSPVSVEAKRTDSLVFEERTDFQYDSAKNLVSMNGKKIPMNQWFNDGSNEIRFIPNPNYRPQSEKKPLFYSIIAKNLITDKIVEVIKVAQASKLSSVIDITYKDEIPKRGEDVLNTLIAVYNKAAINDKNQLATNTLKFINARLALVTTELDSVELGIQKYKTNEGIVDISAQGQMYLDNVGANSQRLSELSVQLAVLDQVETYVKSKSDQQAIIPSTFGVTDIGLQTLLAKLYDMEVQYDGLRKSTAENNPLVQTIRSEIDKMKPNILETVQNLRNNLTAGRNNINSTNNQYSSILKKLPQKERGLVEISRQQTIKNGIYSFLLQKREETALSYNSAVADTRIVDNAESTAKPISPKPLLIIMFAVILALGIGAGLIAIKEVFNRNVIFLKDIEQLTTLPILGEVMQENGESPFVIEEGRRTVIAEQFRHLRTSLDYIGVNKNKNKILFTSSISGEGKSFVSANMAVSLALTNKKVVLIELDLRKPKLSKMFNISRDVGLTNYLIGTKEPDHIIKRTSINDNLFLIPSGAIPPNPSELILNGKMQELLTYLQSIFDYILIDSAPVGPVTDAYILSPMCDATLFVIRHNKTPKAYVKMLDDNPRFRTLKNVNIIFNGVKERGMNGLGYGYGYAYGSDAYGDEVPAKAKNKKFSWPL